MASASTSASTQPSAAATSGPLGDGQAATVEQAQIIANHLGADATKRQRWAPRLIRNTPYMAMTVSMAELEVLAADSNVISIHEDGELQPGLADSIPLIGMPAAYSIGATGLGRGVAILDTGVEYGHVFLTPRVTQATCFSTADANFATLCPNGQNFQAGGTAGIPCNVAGQLCQHGTHVAGIAAGDRASGSPLNGVSHLSTIFAIQVFRRRLSDNALSASDSDMIAALNDLRGRIEGGEAAQVVAINLSIWDSGLQVTGSNCDTNARAVPFKAAVDALRADGVATVIISGNGSQTNQSAFPGCISSAITVSASTKTDVIANYANMSDAVDLLAPGGDGGTVDAGDITSSVTGGAFAGLSGTSQAAPHVTGAFAALRSACPNLPSPQVDWIEGALINTGLSITDTRAGGTISRTRIRVDQALRNLRGTFASICARIAPSSHDFNASSRSDIAWRGSAGQVALWLMNGAAIAQSAPLGTVPTNWIISAQRDFNGDGKHDLLWRDTGGNLALWFINGTTVTGSVGIGFVDTAWTIAGTADFNGDGKADILWRHSSGVAAVWLMNGNQVIGSAGIGVVPTTWQIVGTGDFNGDGKSDILWRDTSGNLAIWFMNGTTLSSNVLLGTVPTNWDTRGTGDFNGDGKWDILWQDSNTGTVAVWLMNGSQVIGSGSLAAVPFGPWQIRETGDFNGDGKSDILWANISTGDVAIWFVNGTQLSSNTGVANVGLSWIVQDLNSD
jgi:hypothetical protein